MTSWRTRTALAAAVALGMGTSGCAMELHPPGQRPGTVSTAVPAVTDNEVTTPPGPEEQATGASSPAAALRDFATEYVNWNAADIKRRLQTLATDSVGQARSAMELAASQTGADPELAAAGIANHGTVEVVARLARGPGRYVVVTRESTTATDSSAYQGLAPAWHLTVATVARRGGGWVISGWQPES